MSMLACSKRPRHATAQLTGVHTRALTAKLQTSAGIADAVEMSPLAYLPGFVTRHAVLKPQLAAAGGTCLAIAAAAEGAWVLNPSGGFHHARPDRAHGFCLVNDVALGVPALPEHGVRRALPSSISTRVRVTVTPRLSPTMKTCSR